MYTFPFRYDFSLSWTPFSDFYASRNSKQLVSDMKLLSTYEEASRLQDWATLNNVSRRRRRRPTVSEDIKTLTLSVFS